MYCKENKLWKQCKICLKEHTFINVVLFLLFMCYELLKQLNISNYVNTQCSDNINQNRAHLIKSVFFFTLLYYTRQKYFYDSNI